MSEADEIVDEWQVAEDARMRDFGVELARALRVLADVAEQEPEALNPYRDFELLLMARDADHMRALRRAVGGKFEKGERNDMLTLTRTLMDREALYRKPGERRTVASVCIIIDREEVCELVQVGEETVMVPDPAYEIPPAPEVPMVEEVRPIMEWKCGPLSDLEAANAEAVTSDG